jgi:hypothetical protein
MKWRYIDPLIRNRALPPIEEETPELLSFPVAPTKIPFPGLGIFYLAVEVDQAHQ